MLRKPSVTYDIVKGWDPEQIAQDHLNMLVDDYNRALFESHLSDIESDYSNNYPERQENYYDNK